MMLDEKVNRFKKRLAFTATFVAVGLGAQLLAFHAVAEPYEVITNRNSFGLKALEQSLPVVPAVALPKLVLTGITTILGDKRALLKLVPISSRPGEQIKEVPLILAESETEAGVQVLSINAAESSVRVMNSGTVRTLTFEKDSAMLSAPLPPAALPAAFPRISPEAHPNPNTAGSGAMISK